MADDRRTIPQVLDRIADQYSEHDALVTPDRRLTFAQLREEVRRAAAAMIELGVSVAVILALVITLKLLDGLVGVNRSR